MEDVVVYATIPIDLFWLALPANDASLAQLSTMLQIVKLLLTAAPCDRTAACHLIHSFSPPSLVSPSNAYGQNDIYPAPMGLADRPLTLVSDFPSLLRFQPEQCQPQFMRLYLSFLYMSGRSNMTRRSAVSRICRSHDRTIRARWTYPTRHLRGVRRTIPLLPLQATSPPSEAVVNWSSHNPGVSIGWMFDLGLGTHDLLALFEPPHSVRPRATLE
ncbi:hypothetical protein C8Q74DRAFT_307890 [Fomes fomentarius]|nr:hypothetical protein C8Q74DRAFT_307890 [Fomes fomentarius]